MGLFSMFSKKNIEEEQRLLKKIDDLEQTIARKDREISDLINELDRYNQSTTVSNNLNSKQLELIEKNLKDTKEENERLKQIIDEYNLSSKKRSIITKWR